MRDPGKRLRVDLNKCFAFLWDVPFKPCLGTKYIGLIPAQGLLGFTAGGKFINWAEMSLKLCQKFESAGLVEKLTKKNMNNIF